MIVSLLAFLIIVKRRIIMSREQVLSDLHKIPGLHSYLQFSADNKTKIDDRLFAHIHLSREMIGRPAYQGHQSEITTQYAAQILRNFAQHSGHKGLWFEHIKQAASDLETACQEAGDLNTNRGLADSLIKHLNKRFKKKSRILAALRWKSDYETNGGHGVLVEFEKINDYQYAIRVMNAGEGLEKHPASSEHGTSNTVLEYRYGKEAFGRVLTRLAFALNQLTANEFYKAISDGIPYSPAESSKTMLTGMCSWKMIIAFLKHRLHNHTAYLRIKQEIEMQSLVDYLLLFNDNPTVDRANHLELAMNNYARFLSEKVKDLDQKSVQNGLQLCQYIETLLKKKSWLTQVKSSPAPGHTSAIKTRLTLPNTARDSDLNRPTTVSRYRCAVDKESSRIGNLSQSDIQAISSIKTLTAALSCTIGDTYLARTHNSPLWKRYLEESMLRLPSIDVICETDTSSKEEKERLLAQYATKLRTFQLEYTEIYVKIDEPHNRKTSPEYVLCSAKLFLEMLKTAHLYFGSKDINLPVAMKEKAENYCSLLNSLSFYQMTEEMSVIRKACIADLQKYAIEFNYAEQAGKAAYYQLRRNFLSHRHGFNEEQLLERGELVLQQSAKDPSQPLSKANPATSASITAKFSGIIETSAEPRIQNGQPFRAPEKLASIENLKDLIIDYPACFVPEFSEDARFIDTCWDFFYASNGAEPWLPSSARALIEKSYYYAEDSGIRAREKSTLEPHAKETQISYCNQHHKTSDQCTDTNRNVYYVKTAASPCRERQTVGFMEDGKTPKKNRCAQHNKDWGCCTEGDRQYYDKRTERSPCYTTMLRNTNAYDYQYQSALSLEVTGLTPLLMDGVIVHPHRTIHAQAVVHTDDTNRDICARLNASRHSGFSETLESQIAISSAMGIKETHIENILQYYSKNIPLLIKNQQDRERLCMVLLRADALQLLAAKNPQIGQILNSFFLAYQGYVNLQVSTKPGDVNLLHFLATFCYHQLPDNLKPELEAQRQSSANNPWGQLTDLYYRMQTDIREQEAECLVSYYSAIHAYSKAAHQRTIAEERMLSQLHYQIVNVYHRFITESKESDANKKTLITEIQKWVGSVPRYEDFEVTNAGPEPEDSSYSSTFFVLEGRHQSLRLNLATGMIEDGRPEQVDVSEHLKGRFPEQLKDVKKLDLMNGKYYFNHKKVDYCITLENHAWVIYRKIAGHWFKKTEYTELQDINFMPNQLLATLPQDARGTNQPKYDFWCNSVDRSDEAIFYAVDKATNQEAYQYRQFKGAVTFSKCIPAGLQGMRFFETTFESAYLTEAFDDLITLPRYRLEFKKDKGLYVWTQNARYALAQLSELELGASFTQFLGLASTDGEKRKVLIPCQSYIYDFEKEKVALDTSGLVDAENTLNTAIRVRAADIRGNSVFHQPGSAHYIECDVDEYGKLSAKKLSDKIYLLYLFLGQSNYTRAFEIFQEIELSGYYSVDKTLYSHLKKILLEDIPLKTKECDKAITGDDKKEKKYKEFVLENGKRAAIQLKMLVNLLSISLCNQSPEAHELLTHICGSVDALLREYEKDYANTPAEMRLTDSERMTLLNFMTSRNMPVDTYLTQKSFNDTDTRPLEAGPRAAIPWKEGEMPSDATQFVADTLFAEISESSRETDRLLKEAESGITGGTLLDDMQLDNVCGEILRKRALEFNQLCVKKALSLHDSQLEDDPRDQFDADIQKERNALFLLAFKNQTNTGRQTVKHVAKVLGRRRAKTNFRILIQLFIQNNPEAYRHQLGELTDEEIHEITIKTANLLRLLTTRKYYDRLIPELNKARTSGNNDKIGELLQERRAYKLDDPNARYYLAYEYLSGILIRESQMKMLTPLLEHQDDSEEHKNYVFQLIMGGGKSKVLMPVSGFLKANGDNLVTVVVPDSLFETNLNDLSRYSQVNFNQKAVPLRFQRSDASDVAKLENIRDRLKEVILNKDYIVTTKTTFQSIELSYLSLLASEIKNPDTVKAIKLLEEILTIIQEKSDVFIDEVDTNLSCFDELNYTLNYLHYPPEYLVSLQIKFFEFLCKDQAGPNSSFYDKLMAPNITLDKGSFNQLLSTIVQRMAEDPESILHTALEGLSPKLKRKIIDYLATNSADTRLPKSFQECDLSKQRIIGFCKAQFNSILPLTLSKEENVNYGFSKTKQADLVDKEIAIPYAGNNNPRETSRFASLYEIFGYTTLAQLKKGVSKACLEKYLAGFIEQYDAQPNDTEKRQLAKTLFEELDLDASAYSIKDILEKDETTFNLIWSQIKDKRPVILLILQKLILNKIKLYPFMLNSNSSDFTSMLHVVQGASGTIDNPGILDPDITFKKSLSLGTDGKTIAILNEKARPDLLGIETKNAKEYLEQLLRQCPDNFHEYQAIIDIGSHFTGVSNQTASEQIADFYQEQIAAFNQKKIADPDAYRDKENPYKFKYVLYFNQSNTLCALSLENREIIELGSSDAAVIKSKLGCEPNQYFAYFDQIHTVGTDLPLAKASDATSVGAKAFVSFAPTTTQQALLQGVMRARDLAVSQNVAFVGNKALRDYLATKGLEANKYSVLRIARENLIEQIYEGSFRAASQKIKAVHRRAVLNKVKQAKTLEEKQQLLKRTQGLVFSKTELDPSKLFLGNHTLENTQDILENLAKSYADSYQDDDPAVSAKTRKKVEKIIQHCMKYCREQTMHTSYPAAQAEVELQAEAEVAHEVEMKAEAERRNELELARLDTVPHYTSREYLALPNLSDLSTILRRKSRSELISISTELSTLLVRELDFGIGMHAMFASPNLLASMESSRFLSQPAVKTCYHILLMENKVTKERHLILLSEQDAETYRQALSDPKIQTESAHHFSLKTMNGHTTCQNANIPDDAGWQRMMDQARFLNGYITEENAWLWEGATKEKLDFYRKFILPYHPSTENSLLFLEKEFKKRQKKEKVLEETPKEAEISPPWITACVALPQKAWNSVPVPEHKKYFSKPGIVPAKKKSRKGYVPQTYREISLRTVMHRCLWIPILGFFIGCIAALVLVIKTYALKRQIKKEGLVLDKVAYQSVEEIKPRSRRWFRFFSGKSIYDRAIRFYKNTKSQYEQAQADALRQQEEADAGTTYTPIQLDELLKKTEVPVVWGESVLVESRSGSGRTTPTLRNSSPLLCPV